MEYGRTMSTMFQGFRVGYASAVIVKTLTLVHASQIIHPNAERLPFLEGYIVSSCLHRKVFRMKINLAEGK
jgi:hypothetical protein